MTPNPSPPTATPTPKHPSFIRIRHTFTRDELAALLHYAPETGEFTWVKTGEVAGFFVCGKQYRAIGIRRKTYKRSHLAWFYTTGQWPTHTIDHINGDMMDDRIVNLRLATIRENNSNLKCHREGHLIGTAFDNSPKSKRHPWLARIKVQGKQLHLGSFATQMEAHARYLQVRKELFP